MTKKRDEIKKELDQTHKLFEVLDNGKTLVYISKAPSSIKPLHDAMIAFHKKLA